jgi:hypothetical protein
MAAILLAASTLLILSCSKEVTDRMPQSDTLGMQKKSDAVQESILEPTGYQALIKLSKSKEQVIVDYNTTGITVTWQYISKGVWKATFDRQAEITQVDVYATAADHSKDIRVGSEYSNGSEDPNEDGLTLYISNKKGLTDKAEMSVHLDIYTYDNPAPPME